LLKAIRERVGKDYPLWIKLGVAGAEINGPSVEEGVETAAACVVAGADCIEITTGLGRPPGLELQAGAPSLLPLVRSVRDAVGPTFPLMAVEGFSTIQQMEEVIEEGLAQLVSLSRPLIAEPDLPNCMLRDPNQACICERCNKCWPKRSGQVTRCRNKKVLRVLSGKITN